MAKGSGGVRDSSRVQTFEQFASSRGASRLDFGDSALHRGSNTQSAAARRRNIAGQARKDAGLAATRESLRSQYDKLTASGRIRAPTNTETLIRSARGHSDLETTQAARRILAKRGVNFQTARIKF